MRRYYYLVIWILILINAGFGKWANGRGKAVIFFSDIAAAREKALLAAKLNALENAFGSSVYGENYLINGNLMEDTKELVNGRISSFCITAEEVRSEELILEIRAFVEKDMLQSSYIEFRSQNEKISKILEGKMSMLQSIFTNSEKKYWVNVENPDYNIVRYKEFFAVSVTCGIEVFENDKLLYYNIIVPENGVHTDKEKAKTLAENNLVLELIDEINVFFRGEGVDVKKHIELMITNVEDFQSAQIVKGIIGQSRHYEDIDVDAFNPSDRWLRISLSTLMEPVFVVDWLFKSNRFKILKYNKNEVYAEYLY